MAQYRTFLRLFLSVVILSQECNSTVYCKNDHGTDVDWYILYKLPKSSGNGLSYLYMDKSTNGWKLSKKKINSKSGALAKTLKPLLDFYDRQTEGFGYLLYNDQPPYPINVSPSYGHSKGLLMLDRETGVWLSHSTPKFPKYRSKDFWPDSGTANAQTFMCVTYSKEQFTQIGLQLRYIHGYPYDFDIPKTFHKVLREVAQKSYPKKAPWSSVETLTSVQGQEFLSFAKYTRFGDDLYSGLIGEKLNQSLYVKSWGRMRDPLPSNCSITYPVYNVEEVELNGQSFSTTVDHSKWCVSVKGKWTCIADMNRETSQMKRGGGAICINDDKVWKAFTKLVEYYEPCEDEQ